MHRQIWQHPNCRRRIPAVAPGRPVGGAGLGGTLGRLASPGAPPARRPCRNVRDVFPQASVRPDLPARFGLEVAGRCLPGSGPAGGDWYDVVTVGRRHVAFCIGDVAGRGAEAAVLMAPLRFAARSYMVGGYRPSAVLGKVSRLVDLDADGRIATAVCGRLDLVSGELLVASAGHPVPFLIDARGCHDVTSVCGPPLGLLEPELGPARRCVTSTVELRPGAAVVAFTDGLFERRGEPIDAGLERMRAALDQSDAWPVGRVLDHLLASMAPEWDDVALLGLRRSNRARWA